MKPTPSPALVRFHREKCLDIPIDSEQVFHELLKELHKLRESTT